MASDLIERLQRFSTRPMEHSAPAIERIAMQEAADCIASLEAEVTALREGLERIAEDRVGVPMYEAPRISLERRDIARAALTAATKGDGDGN